MNDVPLINGINYAWANIIVTIFGVPVRGITKINFTNKQVKKNNYGAGTQPISRGYGNVEPDGSIELYTDELKRIIAAAPGRSILAIPMFDILITYGGNGVEPGRDVLRNCEFTQDGLQAAQGDTSLKVTLPLIVGSINR